MPADGEYDFVLVFAPNNPRENGGSVRYALRIDDGALTVTDIIPQGFRSGDCFNPQWCHGVMINARVHTFSEKLAAGVHTVTVSAVDSEAVLERIIVSGDGAAAGSYLGPQETYYER